MFYTNCLREIIFSHLSKCLDVLFAIRHESLISPVLSALGEDSSICKIVHKIKVCFVPFSSVRVDLCFVANP